jgi:hypothetical protein
MKAFWDERYAEDGFAYGTEPNHFFAEELVKMTPGRLLLPADGEGRNAVFAARKGWKVDAFDQSVSGRKKALALAETHKVSIQFDLSDALEYPYGKQKYDATGLTFVHLPPGIRPQFHQMVCESLKPMGVLILEAFSKAQLGKASGGPPSLEMLFSAEEMKKEFASLRIIKLEQTNVMLQEGKYHMGEAAVIRLVAQKPG